MKKFTRLASIALCLTLAVLALAACGKKDDDTDEDTVTPINATIKKADIGFIQWVSGANATIAPADITEASGVITIKADKDAGSVAIDVLDYFKNKNVLKEGFYFTRSDKETSAIDKTLVKFNAYKHVGHEANPDDANKPFNVYVQYGKADTADNRIVDKTAADISPFALYGETPAVIGSAAEKDVSLVYIYATADDAETTEVDEKGFDQEVTFVFHSGEDKYTLKVVVENKEVA